MVNLVRTNGGDLCQALHLIRNRVAPPRQRRAIEGHEGTTGACGIGKVPDQPQGDYDIVWVESADRPLLAGVASRADLLETCLLALGPDASTQGAGHVPDEIVRRGLYSPRPDRHIGNSVGLVARVDGREVDAHPIRLAKTGINSGAWRREEV